MYDNVKIPASLLNQAIYILESIDVANYCDSFLVEYYELLGSLRRKKDSLNLRVAYAKILYAKDDDSRHSARIQYLQQKRILRSDF